MKKLIALLILLGLNNFGYSQTVTIGNQVWMTKNLDVDKFRNGDPIPEAKTEEEWLKAGESEEPAWCYYRNDPKNDFGEKYGKLYNWYALNDPRGLAPEGFHIPSSEEWEILEFSIGRDVGKKMKDSPKYGTDISYREEGGYYETKWVACSNCKNWNSEYRKKVPCHVCKDERGKTIKTGKYIPKTKKKVERRIQIGGWDGENSSGFSAIPSGMRMNHGGFISNDGARFWSTDVETDDRLNLEWCVTKWLHSDNQFFGNQRYFKSCGLTIRCIKDE